MDLPIRRRKPEDGNIIHITGTKFVSFDIPHGFTGKIVFDDFKPVIYNNPIKFPDGLTVKLKEDDE